MSWLPQFSCSLLMEYCYCPGESRCFLFQINGFFRTFSEREAPGYSCMLCCDLKRCGPETVWRGKRNTACGESLGDLDDTRSSASARWLSAGLFPCWFQLPHHNRRLILMISKSHLNEISPRKGRLCVYIHYSPWLEISTSPGPLQLLIPS